MDTTTKQTTKQQQDQDDITVTYLWFGKSVPEDYLISLGDLNYPLVFLKNPMLDRKFTRELLNIEKSDYYRLQHLYEYGGIYSDFDNNIDYPCLMKLLNPYRNQDKLVFMADPVMTREKHNRMPNHLIYAPRPKMPLLKEMMEKMDQTKPKIWQFGRELFLGQFKEPIELDMSKCVQHLFDWSWYQESNLVLGNNYSAKPEFLAKLRTKKQILQQNAKLEKEIKQEKEKIAKLSNDVIKSNNEKDRLTKQVIEKFKAKLEEAQQKVIKKDAEKENVLKSIKQSKAAGMEKMASDLHFGVSLWQKERQTLQSQISDLEVENSILEHSRDVSFCALGGLVCLIIILLIASIMSVKRTKKGQYSNINATTITVGEQIKTITQ